jgi:hypothetical protein
VCRFVGRTAGLSMGADKDIVEATGGPAYITTTGEASTFPTTPTVLSDPPVLVTENFAGATVFAYHGLQHVVPYPHVFTVRVKPQWRGQGLREVLVREFPSYPPEHYDLLFRAGLVSVGGEVATPDYRVCHQDRISTTITRHELPVRCLDAIRVLERTPDLFVVDKPHSIPAHPSGRFRINSLLTMVEAQVGERLFCVNRLDRLTSGLVLLARYSSLFSPTHYKHYSRPPYPLLSDTVTGTLEHHIHTLGALLPRAATRACSRQGP